ncbi:hypothetical protein F5Y12DRAFT_505026 [Xylaria sp. FL1777]|nr:hypothetical protein F5Y12DRAFT_505026 [Xylaria sp. FL1777]
MSSMSRNNSVNSLMGFSVHQPSIGSPLQFFPAMGSKQLDEMIDAYVPGDASILDKRAAVSMEFFEYTMATGDLFKFFMVYPTLGSTNTSPTMDSDYHSGFTTSPVMSESQWTSTSSRVVSSSSSKKATPANDFSNLPGMKIMTKDGRDVTNSASRGCKTKEQRDHAHLMRIIKACDSCRRKKTKCDPSHKRPAAGTSSGKISKKASKNSRPAAAPPQTAAKEALHNIEFDQIFSASSLSFDSFAESLHAPTDGFSMEWDQFIQYDEEPTEAIPYDYDFFLDPAGFFSPATTASFPSSSTSPSQLPITPIDRDVNIIDNSTEGHDHKPILPYLNPALVEDGRNYVDFNLYSPQSSFLDEDLDLVKEVAASPIHSQQLNRHRHKRDEAQQESAGNAAAFEFSDNAICNEESYSYRRNVLSNAVGDGFFHGVSNHMDQWLDSTEVAYATDHGGVLDSHHAHLAPNRQASAGPVSMVPAAMSPADNVLETVTSEGLYGREAIYEQALSRRLSESGRLLSPIVRTTAENSIRNREEDLGEARQRWFLHSIEVGSINHSDSSSLQPYVGRSCGQDDLTRTEPRVASTATPSSLPLEVPRDEAMGAVRRSPLSIVGFELNVSQENMYSNRYTAIAHIPMRQVSRSSESPSPIATSSLNTESWIRQANSRGSFETNNYRARLLTPVVVAYNTGAPPRSSVRAWNSGSESQYSGERQSFPASAHQMVCSDTLPRVSIIAGACVFALLVSLTSPRTVNGLVKTAQSAVSSNIARVTTAVLLVCIGLCIPSLLGLFLSMSALPIFSAGHTQLQKPTSSPSWDRQSSNISPSHTPSDTRQPHFGLINSLGATYTKIVGVVRCDIAKQLTPKAHPQTPSRSRFSHPEPPRTVEKWAATSLL